MSTVPGALELQDEATTSERFPMFEPLGLQTAEESEQHPMLRTTAEIILKNKGVQSYLLKPKTRPARLICLSFWLVAACGFVALSWFLVPILLKNVVNPIQETVKNDWSPVAVAFLVVGGVALVPIVLLPAGPFIWLAAVSLGVWKGYLVVQLGTAIGMSISYALGKHFLRKRIRKWIEQKDWAQALFIAVKEAGPFKVVLLMRLGPAPYAWFSYACSLSADIHYLPYIAASILGRSPHNLIDIYIGSGVSTAGEAARGTKLDPWLITFYAIGFALAVSTSVWGYVYAKRALRDLRARAVARDQVLTAFSFPELEELDEIDYPVLRTEAPKSLDGSGKYTDLELGGGDDGNCIEGRNNSHSGVIRESSPREGSRVTEESKANGFEGTRVVADCRGEAEDEGSNLWSGQSRSA